MSRKLLIFSVLGILASAGFVWTVGTLLTQPVPMRMDQTPAGAVDVNFTSNSGSKVSGWLFKAEEARAVALLMHGIRSSRRQMVSRAQHLLEMGFTSLVFDFQAHGESPGEMITLGYLESLDAQAGLGFLKKVAPELPVMVVGVSMGGAAALLANPPLDVQVLVLESVYPDARTAIANRLAARFPGGRLLTPLLSSQIEHRIGIPASALAPAVEASRVKAATLVLSGAADPYTTIDDSQLLYDALPEPRVLELLPEAGHVDLEQFDSGWYWAVVEPFIKKHLVAEGGL